MAPDKDLANGTIAATPGMVEEMDEWIPDGRRYNYTLPFLRYVPIVIAVVFVDGILSIVLWLTGGDSEYFVDNTVHFHILQSVFDLALIAALKVAIHAPAMSYLESTTLKQIDDPSNRTLNTTCKLLFFFPIAFSSAVLGYSTTKGILILNSILNDSEYTHMHATYNALVISTVVATVIELGLFMWGFRAIRQLKSMRVLHIFNDDGQEVDKEGNPVKKGVDIKRMLSLAKPETGMLIIATLCLIVASGSQMVAPLFFGKVFDAAQHNMHELGMTVLTLFVIYAFGAVFAMVRSWLFTLAGQRVVARLRKTLFERIISQEIGFFDTNRTGELCNRLSSDTQVLQHAVTVNLSMLSRFLLQMVGSLILMLTLDPGMTGILLSVVPIVSIGAVQYGKYMKKLRQQFQDRLGDAGTTAEESLSSIRTVRSFAGESKSGAAYAIDIDKSYQVGKKLAAAGGIFEGGVGILIYGSISLVLWYGGKLVHENSIDSTTGITPGVFTAFLLYTVQVAMAFALMSALYGDFMQAVGASIRIFELLDRMPTVPNENGLFFGHLDGRVEFKNIHFTYPTRADTLVIKGVSFSVEPGQMVAVVGPSGGGKSTLVNLIERFYDPDSGCITLGDHELSDLDPQWFRKKIAMVGQEPTLFACSIKDNIAYGRDATMENVISVAKQANADEFITSFEKGYETLVGERGVRLSGGQKQRIAIARALIMDPVLLLLDEATSALDAESEHLVQEAVDRAMKGRTVIVIAHRLSTVRNASQVIVIDKGEIAEQGTHDALLERNGVYKKLVLRQLTAGAVSTGAINDASEESIASDDRPLINQLD